MILFLSKHEVEQVIVGLDILLSTTEDMLEDTDEEYEEVELMNDLSTIKSLMSRIQRKHKKRW